jgi:hypothetical protein
LSVLATRQAHTVGDDSEYLLMNQSLLEHGSVDVREGDTFALLVNLPKPWRGHVRRLLRRTPPRGYFESKDGSLHSYHFPFYSLAALPLKGLLHLFGLDESRVFQYTNVLWLVFALFSLRSVVAPSVLWLAFLTPALWYLVNASPESFVFSLGLLGTASYLGGRYRTSILWYSLGAMQFQPLLFVAAAVSLRAFGELADDGFSRSAKARYAASVMALVAVGLAPMLWLFLLFGTPNLVAQEGLASWGHMTYKRFESLFFDLNLGMITYVPGYLLLLAPAIGLRLRNLVRHRRFVPMLEVVLLALGILATTATSNWNSGMTGPSRYVVCFLPPILMLIASDLRDRDLLSRSPSWTKWTLAAALGLQLLAVGSRGVFEYRGASYNQHNRIAQFVLSRWPYLYSPEVSIFCRRTAEDCRVSGTSGLPGQAFYPIIFRTEAGTPKKALCMGNNPWTLLQSLDQPDEELQTRIRRTFQTRGNSPHPFYLNL